jgi:hypothetical protein
MAPRNPAPYAGPRSHAPVVRHGPSLPMSNPRGTPETIQPPPAPAGRGNARALKHGATSELALAPRRERHAQELRRDFPHLDERRLAILADKLARAESGVAWLDRQQSRGVVRSKSGDPFPIAALVDKWETTVWRMLTEIESEAREVRRGPGGLEEHLAARYGKGSS